MANATRIRPVSTETPHETAGTVPGRRPDGVVGFVLAMAGLVAVLAVTTVLPEGAAWAARAVGAVVVVALAAGVPGRVTTSRAVGAVLGALATVGLLYAMAMWLLSQMS